MADDGGDINWYQSDPRALFPIGGIRVSRSLAKTLRNHDYAVTYNTDFEGVMRGCLRPGENWISEDIIRVFCEMHDLGIAHSCEIWRQRSLVGGIYGVALGSLFSAESMFHRETDMSKVALHHMIEQCRAAGFTIFDAQVMNPHLASLGAFNVSLSDYEKMLSGALRAGLLSFPGPREE